MVGKFVAAAKQEFTKALATLKKDCDDFDKKNDHARKEGTILDTSKDTPGRRQAVARLLPFPERPPLRKRRVVMSRSL
jgi:hypothetical protein